MSINVSFALTRVSLVGLLSLTAVAAQGAPRADHTTVDASVIPQAALDNARALTMNLVHASVGGNIVEGLNLLKAKSSARYSHSWADTDRGNPGWQAKVDNFEAFVAANLDAYSVFINKLCYIDEVASFDYYRDSMVKLAARYPSKTFVWFTMPLETTDANNAKREAYNTSVRTYTAQHDLPLYDLADIESHHADGTAVREGGNEALAKEWSSDGGHLNAAGAERAASALWWLMAQMGGWMGGTGAPGGTAVNTNTSVSSGSANNTGSKSSSCSYAASAGAYHGGATVVAVLAATGMALVASRRRRR
jgi:hypothetical protein